MMDHFRNLFAYTAWANDLVLGCLDRADTPAGCVRLMAHVLAAQQEWLYRVDPRVARPDSIWPEWSLEACREAARVGNEQWGRFLAETPDEALPVIRAYKTLSGADWQSSLVDILTHVVNHGTHHRGQVAAQLRGAGIDAPMLDFILYSRMQHPSV